MAMQRWMMFTTALMLSACDTGGGAGAELTVRTWGEEYIEEGIPADVFNDQWSVRYNRFLINLGTVEVGEVGAAPALEQPKFQIYDLAKASKGEGQLVVAGEVPSGTYANTQYKIYPADGSSVVGNAGDADADKPGSVQLTIHGDHLFYDDLFSEEPMLLFGLIAQADDDGDGNGEVTQAELEALDIRPLSNYQVGSTDITDLWHFIEHQTTTLGHIDGEGHCETVRES